MSTHNGKAQKEIFYACSDKGKKFEVVNPLSDQLKVKGKSMNLQIVDDSKGFTYIIYRNKKFMIEIFEKNQNRYTVMINGVWYNFTIETPISYKRRKTLLKNSPVSRIEIILAPMPGKILEILTEENAEIKVGEPIVILEAMKMQNEIVSNVNGIIKKISIKQNDSVMKDNLLVEIEKS